MNNNKTIFMESPFISVVITVLNGEYTLEACLNSISSQTFDDYEVVIVDGGSTDNTVEIAENSNIKNKVIHSFPKSGLYAALNRGVKLAKGQWLYFIGSDDRLYDRDTFQKVSDAIKSASNSYQIFIGNVLYTNSKEVFKPRLGSPHLLRYHVHHQGMFYDRQLFDTILYDESLFIVSDYKLNMTLALKGVKQKSVDITICLFSDEGVSNQKVKVGSQELLKVNKEIFSGLPKLWVIAYGSVRQEIWLLRHKYGLLNIKSKLKNVFGERK